MGWRRITEEIRSFFPGLLAKAYQRQHLKKGPCIVTIGGGTGLSVLLRGLKEYTANLTAIVSVADDGGSSGRLRGQLGVLPPGDLRDCLVALADTESAMESLFNYRFAAGRELAGHSLGNLLLVALADLTGSFETALQEAGKVLAIRGKVVPATYADLKLGAELIDQSILMGQSSIVETSQRIKRVFLQPAVCEPVPEALEAIQEADLLVLGPGSLYTSILPNLLIPGMVEAIKKSKALKVYVCNVLTEVGETRDYTASEHLRALYDHTELGLVDYLVVNNRQATTITSSKYFAEGVQLVEIDEAEIAKLPVRLVQAPLLYENDYLRHDSFELATLLLDLYTQEKLEADVQWFPFPWQRDKK